MLSSFVGTPVNDPRSVLGAQKRRLALNHQWYRLAAICVALTGGCTSAPPAHYQGNPFDEPMDSQESQGNGLPGGSAEVSPTPSSGARIWVPVNAVNHPHSDPAAVAFGVPADAAPIETMQQPSEVASQLASADGADEIFDEAIRIGAGGDIDGQIELLAISGRRGNAHAFYELARMYLNGAGAAKSPDAALGYLNQAMGMGHVESSRVLGWLYTMGSGVEQDVEYGRRLLEQAAETSVRAQREYGMALANLREPNLNDLERGLELLRAAAVAGDAQAERAYESLLAGEAEKNVVVAPRAPSSHRSGSLRERALDGDVEAMYEFALRVSLGKIPDPNPEFTAYCWYSVAASRGHAKAAIETRALSGVRTLADRAEPGRTDAAIAAIIEQIGGGH